MNKFKCAVIVAAIVVMSGCTTLGKVFTPPYTPIVQAAVDVAVATAVQKGVSAIGIKQVALQLQAINNNSTTALATVEAALNVKIASLHLPPADEAGVAILTQTLEQLLNQKIAASGGAINGTTQVDIAEILTDVINATSFYGA